MEYGFSSETAASVSRDSVLTLELDGSRVVPGELAFMASASQRACSQPSHIDALPVGCGQWTLDPTYMHVLYNVLSTRFRASLASRAQPGADQ